MFVAVVPLDNKAERIQAATRFRFPDSRSRAGDKD